ncbi:MAG: DUF2585 family protein [Chthoniobacterales bacterium]
MIGRLNTRTVAILACAIVALVAILEWASGRLPLGPDGRFGFWEGNINSRECSQRIADAYSFSHIAHGILFYAFFWLVARRWPVRVRFLAAVLVESGWELLENSPIIINRYREATMALGYAGDSILNSVSDIGMMSLGFLLAWRANPWLSVAVLVAMEVGCALWIRDNLTLNVIMLIHPVDAIKHWQMGASG